MKLGDWITIISYIVSLVAFFIPEVFAYIMSRDLVPRILLTLLFMLFPTAPSLYDRHLRLNELSRNFPFKPFKYYPVESMKIFDNTVLPVVELFSISKGLLENEVDCSFAEPREFNLPSLTKHRYEYVYWDKLKERLGKDGGRKGSSAKARLFDLKEDVNSRKLVLYFQRTEYWQTLVTNFFLDWKGFDEHLREEIAPKPRLKSLNESTYSSNHLGVNCIVLTKDGTIILKERSKEVVVDRELIGLSAEGGLGWEDRASKDDAPSLFIGMINQIHDELGIAREQIGEIRLIAIYRNLIWGGKPQALFLARINCSFEEVKRLFDEGPESECETKRLIPLNKDDISEINKHLKRRDVSFTAKVGLRYYIDFSGMGIESVDKEIQKHTDERKRDSQSSPDS